MALQQKSANPIWRDAAWKWMEAEAEVASYGKEGEERKLCVGISDPNQYF